MFASIDELRNQLFASNWKGFIILMKFIFPVSDLDMLNERMPPRKDASESSSPVDGGQASIKAGH